MLSEDSFLLRFRRPQQVEQLVGRERREGAAHTHFAWRDRRVAHAHKSESGAGAGLLSPTDLDDGPPVPLVVGDDPGSHNAQEPYFERQRTERFSARRAGAGVSPETRDADSNTRLRYHLFIEPMVLQMFRESDLDGGDRAAKVVH